MSRPVREPLAAAADMLEARHDNRSAPNRGGALIPRQPPPPFQPLRWAGTPRGARTRLQGCRLRLHRAADHFEACYGWRVTDTRRFRTEGFVTIIGAELSSAAWGARHAYWVVAAGLPLDFAAPPADDQAEVITRAHELGAFTVPLHPGLNNLPLNVVESLAGSAVDAVEIYNEALDEQALLDALKRGHYYSTQGPRFEALALDGEQLHVVTSEVAFKSLAAADRWQ